MRARLTAQAQSGEAAGRLCNLSSLRASIDRRNVRNMSREQSASGNSKENSVDASDNGGPSNNQEKQEDSSSEEEEESECEYRACECSTCDWGRWHTYRGSKSCNSKPTLTLILIHAVYAV